LTLIRKHWFSLRVVCGFFLLSFLLGGCAQNQPAKVTEPLVRHSSVHGGQQPVSGSTLQLYAVGTTGDGSAATPLLTQTVTSDASGNFNITGAYTCPSPSTLVYVTATGGNPGLGPGTNNAALALMAALGPCGNLGPSTFISMNELTTVAAVWALAPFMSSYSSIGSGSADATTLASAFTLASEYVNTTTGTAPGLNVPAGLTVPVTLLNTLADILSSCVNSAGGVAGDGSACGTLFAAATPSGGTAPVNVIGAGTNIANNPVANIASIFALLQPTAPFQPTLPAAPSNYVVNLLVSSGLVFSSSEVTFPAAYLSFVSVPQTLTVTNTGAKVIAFSGFSIGGLDASDFQITQNVCSDVVALAPGLFCTIQITFTPSAVGARSAYVNVVSNAANSPQQVALMGTGQADSGNPLGFSPSSLNLTQAGVPQNVIVTNNGSSPVAIGPITSGIASSTNNCGTMLAAQSICTISVAANSVGPSVQSGTLLVINSTGTQTIAIQVGISPQPYITFNAQTTAFGDWAVGVTSAIITVNNLTVTVPEPAFTGAIVGPNASDFSPVAVYPFISGGGGGYGCYSTSCVANITFKPTGTGLRTATIQTSMGDVQLTGNGIPAGPSFTISSYPPAYNPVIVASVGSSFTVNLTVVNNGSTPLMLSGIAVTGADAGDFVVSNPCTATFYSSQICSPQVVFTPSQAGPRTATLTMTDAISGVSKSIPLSGTGGAMIPTITPNSVIFGNVDVGSSSTQTVAITAPDGDPVSFYNYSPNFLVSAGGCGIQTPCQATVTFKPSTTHLLTNTISVVDSYSQAGATLSMQGTGGVATISLSASSLSFAARNQGTTSIPQTVTLTNTGDIALVFSGITFIGANAGDFSLQGNTCGSSVAPGGNCTISVSFNPSASGGRSAILQIMSNAASSPDSVQLLGTGN
jgi:hypothetical protein